MALDMLKPGSSALAGDPGGWFRPSRELDTGPGCVSCGV